MSALQEVMQTVLMFAVAFVVIPVAVFTVDIIKAYKRKGGKNHVGKVS